MPAPTHTFDSSAFATVRIDDKDEVDRLKAELIAVYQPANPEELFAIERLALARHSLLRFYRVEAGFFTSGLDQALDVKCSPPILQNEALNQVEPTPWQTGSYWIATGFRQLCRSDAMKFFLRYQAQTERAYRNALEDLRRTRAQRDQLSAPSAAAQPQPVEPEPTQPPPSPKRAPAPPKPSSIPQPIPVRSPASTAAKRQRTGQHPVAGAG